MSHSDQTSNQNILNFFIMKSFQCNNNYRNLIYINKLLNNSIMN